MKPIINIKPSDYRKLSDEELVRRYVELNEYTAYNSLFERFSHTVFGMCLMLHLGNAPLARRRTEELFLGMLKDIKPQRAGHFKPWLYNYVIVHVTGQATTAPTDKVIPARLPALDEIRKAISNPPAGMEQAMAQLSKEEQLCIRLFYEGSKSFAEIAKQTGLPLASIKDLLQSGKEHVSAQLALSDQLAHIFDKSACLTQRQMKEYVAGSMEAEEKHAVEHHINNCPLCSMAADGMMPDAKASLAELALLNDRFLNDHFSITYPQVQVSSFVADSSAMGKSTKSKKKIPLWVHLLIGSGIAATAVYLYYK